ncbi:MAG: hypothetical protein OHK0039_47400 [Bacteroidia bacterium]
MEVVAIIAEVLKYAAPAAVLFFVVKYMNDSHRARTQEEHSRLLRSEVLRQHLPLKLAAYERAILYLERISPELLVPRVGTAGKQTRDFYQEMVQDIRSEYEHNLAQQLYIHPVGWQALVHAKESMLKLANDTLQELGYEAEAIVFARRLFEKCSAAEELPTHKAIFVLKTDIQRLFQL